jgi:phosphatidylethanolamine/phosphatidyl-N-methylethanolamine N-methyltransferase
MVLPMIRSFDPLQVFMLLATAFVAIPLFVRTSKWLIDFDAGRDSRSGERWIFFRQWLSRPLSTAAFSPSSRFLNRRMVAAIPPGTRRVIELGAGTGALTRALIDHGIAVHDLLAIEFNPNLHRYLSERFPGLAVVRGDARAMGGMVEVVAFARQAPVQAVVSGLGLLSMSREAQYTILADAFELMPEDGSFVQFTYGPVTPVADEVMRRLGLRARRHGFTLRNLPPASVYVFTRAHGELQSGGREIARRRGALDAGQDRPRVHADH